MSPAGLVSAGIAIVRKAGSPAGFFISLLICRSNKRVT
jgi:hypothetical protein